MVTALFQTNVYLLAFASVFALSMKLVYPDISPERYRNSVTSPMTSSAQGAKCSVLKRAMVVWSGAFFPSKSHMKLTSRLQASSILRVEQMLFMQ